LENMNARDRFEDLGADWRIILKLIWHIHGVSVCTRYVWLSMLSEPASFYIHPFL
jgi:hypothetical protein